MNQLDQSILAKAFRGELVPPDSGNEADSELLARTRTTCEAEVAGKPKKHPRKKAARK